MEENFGVINQAYNVSRTELLLWFNETLGLRLHCIEQLGTGAAHVQIFDYYFPGSVKVKKIKWDARNEWGFVENFKLLQQGFDNLGLKKVIDVDRLKNVKYQDNLEFAQWMKRFCDVNAGDVVRPDYNGPSIRNNKHVVFKDNPGKVRSFEAKAKKHKESIIKKRKTEIVQLERKNSRKKGNDVKTKKKPIHPKDSSKYERKRMTNLSGKPKGFKPKTKKKTSSQAIKDIDFVLDTLKASSSDTEKVRALRDYFGISQPALAPTPTPAPVKEEEESEEEVVEEAEVDDVSSDDDN